MFVSLKFCGFTFLVICIWFMLNNFSPVYAIQPIFPLLTVALAISYYERKFGVPITQFPLPLTISALGAYAGALIGLIAVFTSVGSISNGDELGKKGLIYGVIYFFQYGFISGVLGFIVHIMGRK